jgi:hypothetical protein
MENTNTKAGNQSNKITKRERLMNELIKKLERLNSSRKVVYESSI